MSVADWSDERIRAAPIDQLIAEVVRLRGELRTKGEKWRCSDGTCAHCCGCYEAMREEFNQASDERDEARELFVLRNEQLINQNVEEAALRAERNALQDEVSRMKAGIDDLRKDMKGYGRMPCSCFTWIDPKLAAIKEKT